MKKRLISLLLTAMMIMTIVPTFNVSAATAITTGWENNSKGVSGATEIAELCTDPANVLSGNNSLHIKYVPAVEDSTSDSEAGQAQARCGQWSNTGVNWTLTFWAKFVTGDITGLKLGFFEYVTAITEDNAVDGAVVDGWQKYSITATDKANNNERFYIISNFKDVEVYLDNFTLTCAEGCAGGHDNHGLDILNDTTGATTKKINSGGIGETAEDPLSEGEEDENEKDDSYVPSVTPDTTGTAMDGTAWIENTTDAGFSQEGTVKDIRYSTKEAYEGNGSFHIQYDEPKDTDGTLGLQLRNKTILPTTQNATYTVSFYAKGTGLENVQTAYPRYDKISLTDTSWYKTTATDKEGWVKYTYTRNIPGSSCDTFRIYVNDKADFYIDELVITDQAGTTEYLNLDFNIEEVGGGDDSGDVGGGDDGGDTGETYVPSVTADTTGSAIDSNVWTENQGTYSQTGTKKDLRYSTQDYFKGNRSMHIQYDEPKDESGALGLELRVKAPELPTTKNETYTVSFYAKGTGLENVGTVYPRYDRRVITDTNWYTATATDKDGWKKYTHTQNIVGSAPNTFRIQITAKADFYIDEIVITDSTGKEHLNLNFDFEMPSIVEDVTMEALSNTVNSLTGNITPTDGNKATFETMLASGEIVYDHGVSYLDSASGNRSLHIQFDTTDANAGRNVGIKLEKKAFSGDTNYYKLSFKAKGTTKGLGIAFYSWNQNKIESWTTTNTGSTTPTIAGTDADGWTTYEMWGQKTTSCDTARFIVYGETDIFIDDIQVVQVNSDGSAIEGATDLYEGAYNFDTAETSKAFSPIVYDEDGNTVDALTIDHSEKKLTVKGTVANWSDDTYPETAQIFIVVTKGDLLVDMSSSDVKAITKGGAAAVVGTDITMPTFTDASEYDVTVYFWNSRDGLIPLTASKEL